MFEWLDSSKGTTAYITHPACFGHNMGEGHPESPERLVAIKNRLIEENIFDSLQHITPEPATNEQIALVHPLHYIEYLESVSPHVGTFRVDTDTAMNSGTVLAMRYAAGAVIKAVDMVMNGEAPNAFCAIRPPGHHAELEKPMGFCFINNAGIGAMHAIQKYGLKRILIVDFDVHHGNGTEDVFKNDERIMLLSTFEHPFFPYSGDKPLGNNPNIVNIPLPAGTCGLEYREVVVEKWLPAIERFNPELIIIGAGFDAHREDDMGNFGLIESDYTWITQHLLRQAQLYCQGRLVSVLEGGYDPDPLARSVAAHLRVLADTSE